jgi:hypothetical protein
VPQTSANRIAMMAHIHRHVKDTSHECDGEKSFLSDVEIDDEITPRDERERRTALDVPSAESTTKSFEVRVKGQICVNEVVDVSSDNTRLSPRFYIGSTGVLPGRGIGDERFLGGRSRTNNNRTLIRSTSTGKFISSKQLTLQSPGTTIRSVTTGRFFHGGSVNHGESAAIDRTVRPIDGSTPVSSRHIICEVYRGYVDNRWYPRCHKRSIKVQIPEEPKPNESPADNGKVSEA